MRACVCACVCVGHVVVAPCNPSKQKHLRTQHAHERTHAHTHTTARRRDAVPLEALTWSVQVDVAAQLTAVALPPHEQGLLTLGCVIQVGRACVRACVRVYRALLASPSRPKGLKLSAF